MDLALAVARRALGRTSPNPAVGAVIVKDGRVVGQGWTRPPGGPHAEVVALQEAGEAARDSVMYVTLEPCCHFGRTPPCTQAIIAAGISEVQVATRDANPLVGGRGCAELEAAGVRVRVGARQQEARELNEAFWKYITTGLPFVTVKWAMTLDGKIASRAGHSRWITGDEARLSVHRMRDVCDAIVVGANTVRMDDPQLTVRLPEADSAEGEATRAPLRVVVSSRDGVSLSSRVFSSELARGTLVATTKASDARWRQALAQRGVEVVSVLERNGFVDLHALMKDLAGRQRMAVLVEGGGHLIAGFLNAGLVDKVCAFVAPKIIGGEGAPSPVRGEGLEFMHEALRVTRMRVATIGEDVLLTGYLREAWES